MVADLEVTNERPKAAPGDWFRTRRGRSHCCKMYCLPGRAFVGTIDEGTYIGPVHNVKESAAFVAVLVPSLGLHTDGNIPDLVWVSVHCAHNLRHDWNRPVADAPKVGPDAIDRWKQNGLENQFIEGFN